MLEPLHEHVHTCAVVPVCRWTRTEVANGDLARVQGWLEVTQITSSLRTRNACDIFAAADVSKARPRNPAHPGPEPRGSTQTRATGRAFAYGVRPHARRYATLTPDAASISQLSGDDHSVIRSFTCDALVVIALCDWATRRSTNAEEPPQQGRAYLKAGDNTTAQTGLNKVRCGTESWSKSHASESTL